MFLFCHLFFVLLGCPYAAGAAGNVSTEDVVYLLHGMNIDTGVDLEKLVEAGHFISKQIGRRNMSKVGMAMGQKIGKDAS